MVNAIQTRPQTAHMIYLGKYQKINNIFLSKMKINNILHMKMLLIFILNMKMLLIFQDQTSTLEACLEEVVEAIVEREFDHAEGEGGSDGLEENFQYLYILFGEWESTKRRNFYPFSLVSSILQCFHGLKLLIIKPLLKGENIGDVLRRNVNSKVRNIPNRWTGFGILVKGCLGETKLMFMTKEPSWL